MEKTTFFAVLLIMSVAHADDFDILPRLKAGDSYGAIR